MPVSGIQEEKNKVVYNIHLSKYQFNRESNQQMTSLRNNNITTAHDGDTED